jgi:hypothetical protein
MAQLIINFDGIDQTIKDIRKIIRKAFFQFGQDLKPIVRRFSPVGPSGGSGGGLKQSWDIRFGGGKNPMVQVFNRLDYAARQNTETLFHVKGMKEAKDWDRSFGDELGGPRAAWAQRVYGTDTPPRIYYRGYRRAKSTGAGAEYKAEFMERALEQTKATIVGKEGSSDDLTYNIDISNYVQPLIDEAKI